MESGLGSTKLPPSMQKQHGSSGNVYMASQERRNEDSRSPYVKEHRPEPDSDSVSNVSMESGLNSPTGDGSKNTLEKGIDGDIRHAARNVKKQMTGRESSLELKHRTIPTSHAHHVDSGLGFRDLRDMHPLVQALEYAKLLILAGIGCG